MQNLIAFENKQPLPSYFLSSHIVIIIQIICSIFWNPFGILQLGAVGLDWAIELVNFQCRCALVI